MVISGKWRSRVTPSRRTEDADAGRSLAPLWSDFRVGRRGGERKGPRVMLDRRALIGSRKSSVFEVQLPDKDSNRGSKRFESATPTLVCSKRNSLNLHRLQQHIGEIFAPVSLSDVFAHTGKVPGTQSTETAEGCPIAERFSTLEPQLLETAGHPVIVASYSSPASLPCSQLCNSVRAISLVRVPAVQTAARECDSCSCGHLLINCEQLPTCMLRWGLAGWHSAP